MENTMLMVEKGCSNTTRDKEIPEREEYEIGLALTVLYAEGIDPLDRTQIPLTGRFYDLVWWVEPEDEYWVEHSVIGLPNPIWNAKWAICFPQHVWPGYLHVEIVRRRNNEEPGTSGGIPTMENPDGGIAAVNRVRISLPRPGENKYGPFELVKSVGPRVTREGQIHLEIETFKLQSCKLVLSPLSRRTSIPN